MDDFTQTLNVRENRRCYLITYSQADLEKVPTCQRFAEIMLQQFQLGTSNKVIEYWAVSQEDHSDGGKHYHMSVKFSGTRRWNPIKDSIRRQHGIVLNFSSQTLGYVAAYRYVAKSKQDNEVLRSPNHPDLSVIGSPRTKKAFHRNSTGRKRSGEPLKAQQSSNAKRLRNSEVSEFLVKHEIKTETALMRLALQRQEAGDNDLHKFILDKSPKALADIISTTWKMQHAPATVERSAKTRIQIVEEISENTCIDNCNGIWLQSAMELLLKNKINKYVFANALRQALIKGRCKHTNVMLVGPTNCGKSFLLNPLEVIFRTFMNPATGRYAWVGLDECEVAFLNDFRWSSECINWSDFLLLLEGQTVHLPRPKNQFCTDLEIHRENTIPFFATSKSPIIFEGKYNQTDQRETDMMASRWNTFEFTYQISISEVRQLDPCPSCFAKLVLTGADE